jgi:hypothetical protein
MLKIMPEIYTLCYVPFYDGPVFRTIVKIPFEVYIMHSEPTRIKVKFALQSCPVVSEMKQANGQIDFQLCLYFIHMEL